MPLVTRYVPQLALQAKNPIAMIVNDGRRVGIIRPSRRIKIQAPLIEPATIKPLPKDIVLVRKSRYAQRKCPPKPLPLMSLGVKSPP